MRWRSLVKAVLAGAVALTVLAGMGAAAIVAATDDDEPTLFASDRPAGQEPERSLGVETQPSPAPETTPAPDPPTETAEQPPEPVLEPPPEPAPADAPASTTRKTRFPRERKQPDNDPAPRNFAIPPAREFSGTGNASLGTVQVLEPAVVRWRTKGRFELRFGRESFPITAPSATGQLIVPPYSFDKVRVIATGRWTIRITPQN